MNPLILIVEDIEKHLNSNEKYLLQINADRRRHVGIGEFFIHKAKTQEEAMALLQKAVNTSSPFDLLLLDLGLPLNEADQETPPERGLEILEFVQKTGGARSVIVASVFRDYEYVVEAFRRGAVDFIAKPYERATLQEQVLKYFESEGVRLLEQRLRDLVPLSEKGLAHRLGACFSRFVQAVVNEAEELEEGFKERWGLDIKRDFQDSQVRHLATMEEAVISAKSEWTEIVSSLIGGGEALGVCIAEDTIREVEDTVRPCLALKQVRLNWNLSGNTPVRTFHDDSEDIHDVKTVLKEIILGALSELTNHDNSRPKTIDISVDKNGDRAQISFEDNFSPISQQAIEYINNGIIVAPGKDFGRPWGLSVAQHLALRGGGRIRVQSSEEHSVITYSVPLVDHA